MLLEQFELFLLGLCSCYIYLYKMEMMLNLEKEILDSNLTVHTYVTLKKYNTSIPESLNFLIYGKEIVLLDFPILQSYCEDQIRTKGLINYEAYSILFLNHFNSSRKDFFYHETNFNYNGS